MDVVTGVWARNQAKNYTDTKIAQIPKSINWKGSVNYYADLPANPTEGDAYTVLYKGTSGSEPSGAEYAWGKNMATGMYEWVKLGEGSGSTPTAANVEYDHSTSGLMATNVQNAIDELAGSGGASSWSNLTDKPFETIGDNLKIVGRALTVDTAPNVEQDNTKPITSAAVYTEVGNINALLALI